MNLKKIKDALSDKDYIISYYRSKGWTLKQINELLEDAGKHGFSNADIIRILRAKDSEQNQNEFDDTLEEIYSKYGCQHSYVGNFLRLEASNKESLQKAIKAMDKLGYSPTKIEKSSEKPYGGRASYDTDVWYAYYDNYAIINDAADYNQVAEILKDNFYIQFLRKMQVFLSKTNQAKNFEGSREMSIMNGLNKIVVEKRGNLHRIYINNDALTWPASEKLNAAKLASRAATDELAGRIKVNRPKGRTIQKDRAELSPVKLEAAGIKVPPSIYNALKTDANTGRDIPIMKQGQLKKRIDLDEGSYKSAVAQDLINPNDYIKLGTRYVKRSKYVDLGDLNATIYDTDTIIARSPKGKEFEELYNDYSDFAVTLNGQSYIIHGNKYADKL